MTELNNNMRCFWCNHPATEEQGGIIKNGITFCWMSYTMDDQDDCICARLLEKTNTIIDNYTCPVCLESKKAMDMPRCNHKVCLECYKTIFFGSSELEKPCVYDLIQLIPNWTYEQQTDENGEWKENEKENIHDAFLEEKMNYKYEEDKRTYDELIMFRNNLMIERFEWMNNPEVIGYENELFKIMSEYRIKKRAYLSNRTAGQKNKCCPLCRAGEKDHWYISDDEDDDQDDNNNNNNNHKIRRSNQKM